MHKIIHGDCLTEMVKMESNSIDFIVTDPPYGLKFMGRDWDQGIPGIKIWKQALRICKPGAMMAAFGGTRTFHRLTCLIEDAGWEIRDCIMWLYGSGFPKSHNKFGFEGYGTSLKPAWEPIILAMKPCDGTFSQNIEKWGLGGINIDETRIECEPIEIGLSKAHLGNKYGSGKGGRRTNEKYVNIKGRWPANLILDEEAAEMLDQQSGILKSGSIKPHHKFKLEKKSTFGQYASKTGISMPENSGGASRFFYCAKASSKERNSGLENQNNHPTVKPISLMKYIIKLLAPPGSPTLLDPFAGSGSTICAAVQLGINAIGIEKEKEYCEIAEKRVEFNFNNS